MRKSWLKGWLSGGPHFVIGSKGDPYLFRWYVVPRNPVFNVYVHKFLRDDEDRALHDHPWWFLSVMVKGAYDELTDAGTVRRSAFSVAFRRATHRHWVVLDRDAGGRPVPCWTFIVTGRVRREWGFWCPKGFVSWKDFTAPTDYGQVGKGCD